MTTSAQPARRTRWLSIVGIGEDGVDGLSPVAQQLIAVGRAGGRRQAPSRPWPTTLIRGRTLAWPSPIGEAMPEIEKHRGRPVVVLASGDPFHYGVGDLLLRSIPADETLCLPQPSAFSLAAARLGWSLQDVALVSLHGRALEGIVRHLQPGARILALVVGRRDAGQAREAAGRARHGRLAITVLEAHGRAARARARARRRRASISPTSRRSTPSRSRSSRRRMPTVLALAPGLDDDLFEHDGQLTKREVRAVTLSALAPRQGELLWDVGLGAGSIAIEWLLRHPSLQGDRHRGPSRSAPRARRATPPRSARPISRSCRGARPRRFAGLPAPDAVFIGGGLSDPGVFEAAWSALKPGGRLVANAVSLQSEARLIEFFQRHGGELVRLEVAKAGKAGTGGVFVWRPAVPIVQWRVRKP